MYYDVKNPLQLLVVMILEDSNSIKYFYENQSNFVKFGMHNIYSYFENSMFKVCIANNIIKLD
jgi:hypothetical protein